MKNLTEDQKQEIVDAIVSTVGEIKSKNLHKSCLQYASTGVDILNQIGFYACLQAGSVSYKVIPDEHDDGVSPNYFSYVSDSEDWDESRFVAELVRAFQNDTLPELHVWIGLPEENEIIDLTTRYVPQLSKEAGVTCLSDIPDYVWGNPVFLAESLDFRYCATRQATLLAAQLLEMGQDDTIAMYKYGS